MRKVYICSPYRAKDGAELDRNIDYAQQLTRQALEAGLAPITPHLYMTQCMDDKKPEERARGMAAGLALLKGCDFVIAGVKYGITEGMDREIHTANMLGIAVIDANQIKRHLEYEEKRQERAASDYAKLHSCEFCKGGKLYSCTGYDCREPYRRAYEYALSVTLCWDNLEALCQDCHNKEHHKQEGHKRYQFDENGGILPPYQKNN